MKHLALGILTFLLALLAGYIPAEVLRKAPKAIESQPPAKTCPASAEIAESLTAPQSPVNAIDFIELPDVEDREYSETAEYNLIDIYETDAIYRKSEVIAKTGETWLTLIEKNGKYSLVNSKAKLTRKRTISYPGDEPDVKLSFDTLGIPIFAVRNIKSLSPGSVTTLYHRPSWKEIDRRNLPIEPMKLSFERVFDLNGNRYILRAVNGITANGTKATALVLEHNNVTQIIDQNYEDIIGDLLWVGDLDNDGKIDLYFDQFNERGSFGIGLYLSSEAKDGEFVRLVAIFGTAGC